MEATSTAELEGDVTYHKHAAIIMEIRSLINRFDRFKIQHTLREGNMCADYLAKRGASKTQTLVMLQEPIPEMSLMLLADASGVTFTR
ncbi:Ribonuclease H-like superfamily [Sesbania bispinosa]|nr:Ribonuclease H-like superfamily [Sesbania bispinosa]